MSIAFLAAALLQANAPVDPWLPSSYAINIATKAAKEWNRGPLPEDSFFDIVDPALDKMPGYTSVIYYVHARPVLDISINRMTGQVVDKNRCLYFHSTAITAISSRTLRDTGATLIPLKVLASQIGCDRLTSP